jgi:hypothetical protein
MDQTESAFTRRAIFLREYQNIASGNPWHPEGYPQYRAACVHDFGIMNKRIFAFNKARMDVVDTRRKQIGFIAGDKLTAQATGEIGPSGAFEIELAMGLMLALDDLLLRACSSRDFFSIDAVQQNASLWKGCHCLLPFGISAVRPVARFFDYNLAPHVEGNKGGNGSWLYAVYSSYPMDAERRKVADQMFQLALSWLIAHEDSHYTNFHLELLHHPGFREDRENSNIPSFDKMAEWQADRDAALAVLDLVFNPTNLATLPSYITLNHEAWLARLAANAASCIFLIAENALINRGNVYTDLQRPNYFSPRTRILIFLTTWIEEFMHADFRRFNVFEKEGGWTNQDVFFVIFAFVHGVMEDIDTLSNIFCREANNQNAIEEWKPGQMPVFARQKNLVIIDRPQDALGVGCMIMERIAGMDSLKHLFPAYAENWLQLQEELWFDEYQTHVAPYIDRMDKLTEGVKAENAALEVGFLRWLELKNQDPNFFAELQRRGIIKPQTGA